ncbi:hypothetical protein MKW98_029494 [Papaver atlanticum]|uniref:R13L1/DRL21-like LRR repeat region domain-containing protein n=1 Tax=Papaver atlanticum TaxID=357466 RepID=A0AAD4XFG9_9MAGN|nr:hypothetical protein MKW98_029494 [Papaver atlanticum]
MIGLEYLTFSGAHLTQMPREVSRLSKLKKLSVFIVGKEEGCGIEELKDLNFLGSKLRIENLQSVTDATQANLMDKKNIIDLKLRWDSQSCNDPDIIINDTVVINDLQPHRNLKKLTISDYAGSKFPTWMMSTSIHLPNLVYISLDGCNKCEQLPALGELQSLRYLYMHGLRG